MFRLRQSRLRRVQFVFERERVSHALLRRKFNNAFNLINHRVRLRRKFIQLFSSVRDTLNCIRELNRNVLRELRRLRVARAIKTLLKVDKHPP